MTRSTTDGADVDARLRSYEAARCSLAVAEEVLEWMTLRVIEGMEQNRVYNPREIAATLGVPQRDVVRRMVPDQDQSYGRKLSPEARKRVAEIMRQVNDTD